MNYEIFYEKFVSCFNTIFSTESIEHKKYSEKTVKNFYEIYKLLITENKKYNLTSITQADEVIVKHFADSVMPLIYFDIPVGAKIIDIGTGAGFPGLPLYMFRNDLNITFLDSSSKKINFVKSAVKSLNIDGTEDKIEFVCGRAEDIGRDKNYRETYDFAVSRAVAKLDVLCELAAPLIRVGGHFISYKGRNYESEIIAAKNAVKILGLEIAETRVFDIAVNPLEKEGNISEENTRALIKIKKLKSTDLIYPRSYSKISKIPL